MNIRRVVSQIAFVIVTVAIVVLLASLGAMFFFVLLGVVAITALYHAFQPTGNLGGSRDSAFAFRREDYRVKTNDKTTVIETEYHEVTRGEQSDGKG